MNWFFLVERISIFFVRDMNVRFISLIEMEIVMVLNPFTAQTQHEGNKIFHYNMFLIRFSFFSIIIIIMSTFGKDFYNSFFHQRLYTGLFLAYFSFTKLLLLYPYNDINLEYSL